MSSDAPKSRSSKRSSVLPTSSSAPKPPTTLDPAAIIADKAILVGTHRIIVGAQVVLHPHARIESTSGPVTVADGAVIWERARVCGGDDAQVRIGRNVVLETGVRVEGDVGDGSVVEAYAQVGAGARIGMVSISQVKAYGAN
jgi:dynactin 6